MCLGCGVCAYMCPENLIELTNIMDEGIRPIVQSDGCGSCTLCLDVCPGHDYSRLEPDETPAAIKELEEGWGPVLEIWEGYPADKNIHYQGSSAGMSTAIALYCLERGGMHGVVHIAGDKDNPLNNKTIMSHSRAELLASTGSRYAPASPCSGLGFIEEAPDQCVFIGKPCDVAAVRKAQYLKPILKEKIGVTISIFCAGTPASRGTTDFLAEHRIDPNQVQELRYRGCGWPGHFTVRVNGQDEYALKMTYGDSWDFLQRYRPYRCHLCPDGTGEFADIACGDPWYREIQEGALGSSLVVVRTERGRRIVREAMEAGYIHLKPGTSEMLVESQRNLLSKRSSIWGRSAAFKVIGQPAPKMPGYNLFKLWLRIPLKEKARSFLGTLRRIIQRKYYKPLDIHSMERLN